MSDEAGAYIWKDGVLIPDLDDEAMAGRQPQQPPKEKNKKTAAVEVTNAQE